MSKVIMYSTPTCVFCKMTKEFFEANKIAYEERDVSEDPKAQEEMIKKSGQLGVPVIDIDGKIVIGFDKGKLGELLGIS